MLVVAAAVGVSSCFGAPVSGERAAECSALFSFPPFGLFLTHVRCLDIWGSAPPASLTVNFSPPPRGFVFLLTPCPLTSLILPPRHPLFYVGKLLRLTLTTGWNVTQRQLTYHDDWQTACLTAVVLLSSAGVLFSVEVMSSHFALKHYCPCFFSAACGALTFRLLSVWSEDLGTVNKGNSAHCTCRKMTKIRICTLNNMYLLSIISLLTSLEVCDIRMSDGKHNTMS